MRFVHLKSRAGDRQRLSKLEKEKTEFLALNFITSCSLQSSWTRCFSWHSLSTVVMVFPMAFFHDGVITFSIKDPCLSRSWPAHFNLLLGPQPNRAFEIWSSSLSYLSRSLALTSKIRSCIYFQVTIFWNTRVNLRSFLSAQQSGAIGLSSARTY